MLSEIIKELLKDFESAKQEVAAFCVAEKNVQRMLNVVNESMSINDIKNCSEVIFADFVYWNLQSFTIFNCSYSRSI